ncbi:MAG TPA: hypothetical protein VFD05_01080 [Bacilli bacterium]|nr:hypothetical protein [Bacilli bacterium]
MEKRKNLFRKKKLNIFLLLFSILTSVTATIAFTYAAYVYDSKYSNVVDFNLGKMGDHFDGGTGTEGSPYLIANPDHLRTLQRLTVLGLFSNNTHFKLTQSFTWSGDRLLPIGTEDNPFYGVFQGNGAIITSLEVDGNNTNDIGMFGYVAYGAVIKNFILDKPTIYVNTNDGGGTLRTTNPLASLFASEAQSLNLAFTQKSGQTPAYFVPNKETISNGGITYHVTYESTNNDYLEWKNNRFEVKTPVAQGEIEKYPVQVNAKVLALHDEVIIAHTLERWHINVNLDGTVDVANTSTGVKVGYWKTIHDTAGDSFGPHETYVGFFVGHLDGEAKYLGLNGGTSNSTANNGKIIISGRAAKSYGSLVGRTLDDNINDAANAKYKRINYNFSEYTSGVPITWTTPATLTGNPNASAVNTYYNNTETVSKTISSYYDLTTTEQNYFRIYGTAQNKMVTYDTGLTDENDNPLIDTSPSLTWNEALKGITTYDTSLFTRGARAAAINNGIWVWFSADQASGFAAIMNTTGYEAQITVRYVVPSNTYVGGGITNYFRILNNSKKSSHGFLSPAVENSHWKALGASLYDYTDYPVVQFENGQPILDKVIEQQLSFQITKSGSIDSWWGGSRQSMIAIGIGGPTITEVPTFGSGNPRLTITELDSSPFEVNIVDFDIFFTSLEGSLSRQMASVDYINSLNPTFNAAEDSWNNWMLESGTRVRFDVAQSLLTGSNAATYRFYRASGSNGRVNVYYTGLSGNDYRPVNTEGFKTANITNG